MRYIFKILLLGLDGEAISFYALRAFGEEGENKGAYLEFYKEVKAFEDICDLEVNAITDVINADFDDIVPTVDGIVYFLNPLNEEENEFFDIILPIVKSVKRNIPIVLMYYDQQGILPLSVNEMLESLWFKYLDIEAFVNLPPREFHQVLQCLCVAMITGISPLNIENAWMRFPIYIQLANIFFKKAEKEFKPEFYFFAAQAIKKAAIIADILNKEEFYIMCEQAAFLYSKVKLYLDASQILQNVDKKKSENFKKLYADSMVLEGNKLFNKRQYDLAARQYLAAAQWSSIELKDNDLRDESFLLAINSWVSACKVENAFEIINSLPHEKTLLILREIPQKIIAMADYLIKERKYLTVRDQLYSAVSEYQQEGLFDELEKVTSKLTEVLITLLKQQLKEEKRFFAKQSYDEIENLWETYNVKKSNVDAQLEKLIKLFLDNLEFGNATILTNKLNSLSVKKKLTKLSSKVEDENKELIKKEIEENIEKGVEILNGFIEKEIEIFTEINTLIIQEANSLIESNDYPKAANLVKIQADFFKRIAREDIQNQMLKKTLDILLIGKIYDQFFKVYRELSKRTKKEYLKNKLAIIIEKLNEIVEERDYEENEKIFELIISIFREQMLYEQSKEISSIFIESIKAEGLKIVESSEDKFVIETSLDLIKKATDISSAYMENPELSFNKIYKRITEIYITLDDLSSAHAITDKIDDKSLKTELNKRIENLEAEKSAIIVKKAEESFEGEVLKERLSIIQSKAREAFHDKEREFKQRKAFKKTYYLDALAYLSTQDLDNAIEEYKESIKNLIRIKKYNLAGVSLAVLFLLLIKQNKIEDINKILIRAKTSLSSLEKSFTETFPVSLVEYLIDIEKLSDPVVLNESIQFMENLPLFEEETFLISDILGKSHKIISEPEDLKKQIIEIEKIKDKINELSKSIQKERKDVARRKLMKNQYWKLALEDLSNKKFQVAINEYSDTIPKLLEKDFPKQASISLILSTFLMVKTKGASLAQSYLIDKLAKHKKHDLEDMPEIQITKELLSAMDNNDLELIGLCLDILIDKLTLFDPEILLLESLLHKKKERGEEEVKLTRKEVGKINLLNIEMDQIDGKLRQKEGDTRRERDEFLKKRSVMKKRYYKDVIESLESTSFKKAGLQYLELAKATSKRKDLRTSSLLILLHGLSLLKVNEPIKEIKTNIKIFLDLLGLNKQLVEDTFHITLIKFYLDVISHNLDKYLSHIREMLELLPLFEEERQLIEI